MDAVASSDVGREGHTSKYEREQGTAKTTPATIDYVRNGAAAAHIRGASGSLLSKLGFSRSTAASPPSPELQNRAGVHQDAVLPRSAEATNSNPDAASAAGRAAMSNGSGKRASTMPLPSALGSGLLSTRSRKGSLRKNILQKGSIERMETILSPRMESRMSNSTDNTDGSAMTGSISPDVGEEDGDYPTPRPSYDATDPMESRRSSQSSTSRSSGRGGDLRGDGSGPPPSLSRSSTMGDTLTTDEDEKPPGSSSSNGSSVPGLTMPKRSATVSDSYFPPQIDQLTGLRRRSSPMKSLRMTKSSPLSALPLDATSPGPLSPEAWDYAETEWWGWIILVVTWITFVVGMGSCFGAWSWAWDVGETPYAPPELEDDPTLPIVGYYPALMVLTGVMAWVWVITAWVGMKYFKHAKMAGEDG